MKNCELLDALIYTKLEFLKISKSRFEKLFLKKEECFKLNLALSSHD